MQPEHPTLLAALVARDDRTQEEIVNGYEDCARRYGEDATLSLRTFRRWIAGDVLTSPRPAQCRVARLYWGFTMSQLLAPIPATPRAVPLPDTNPRTTLLPWVDAWPAGDGGATTGPGDHGNYATELERQVAMATRRAARFTAFAEASNVGPETLDQLRDEASVLANAYIREPLTAITGELVEVQDAVFRLLEGKQKPTQTRDLYMLAGITTGLIAKASHDLGRSHEAMTQARTVYVCADNAGHDGLRAWARGLQSLIAYWAGRPEEAVRFAQAGAELGSQVSGTTSAWLPALEARAWAQLSRARETTQAVQRAIARRAEIQPDDLDHIGGLLSFPLARQHYYLAGAYVFLDGKAQQAREEANQAVDLYEHGAAEERSFSDEAGARAELSLARVIDGEVEGGKEALAPVLALSPEQRIGGIVASVARVHNALRTGRHATAPVAKSMREEIETFCQLPAAALPR